MTLYHPRPERWPQVSLRGFFMLVALSGVLCWLGVQVKWITNRHEALSGRLAMIGGKAPWSLRIVGEPGIEAIWYTGDPEEWRQLQVLFPEAKGFKPKVFP